MGSLTGSVSSPSGVSGETGGRRRLSSSLSHLFAVLGDIWGTVSVCGHTDCTVPGPGAASPLPRWSVHLSPISPPAVHWFPSQLESRWRSRSFSAGAVFVFRSGLFSLLWDWCWLRPPSFRADTEALGWFSPAGLLSVREGGRGREEGKKAGRERWLQPPNPGPSESPSPGPFPVETPDPHTELQERGRSWCAPRRRVTGRGRPPRPQFPLLCREGLL